MIKKGKISSFDTIKRKAKVIFEDIDNSMSNELDFSEDIDINKIEVGKYVLVAFYGSSLSQGVIICNLRS